MSDDRDFAAELDAIEADLPEPYPNFPCSIELIEYRPNDRLSYKSDKGEVMYDTAELENEKAAYPPNEGKRIQVEHDQMRASLERLEKEAMRLTDRLEKVVQPARDADVVPMQSKPTADVPISPLAARLQDDRRNIDRLAERLSDVCDRLET